MAWIDISISIRDNSDDDVASKKVIIFYIYFETGTWTSESTGCKQPLLVP